MSNLADDWDAVPVKAATSQGATGVSDWDAIPVKASSAPKGGGKTVMDVLNARMGRAGDAQDGIASAAGKMIYDTGAGIINGWRGLASLAAGSNLSEATAD